ncbi:hypothetical protein Kpol_1013p66 [Vanderwaltozyma polyspora DSM 70294]|uniref:Protein yippee-like n=1 Tax=Vanderwaltozyma polyspora (strain ATCC 22028 / DSM 70294 / BCRC 21397 / CBS 2163 / NBRC 10782 / NRRL Y-8283 / UCD 57-17) TaxID=436907 RepID=A7THB0_VANPO|nr:uncharacterized protein Kpol_1013p66 [Vanderwaltozyma polyspora DSM 70294]EDO18391.1 hypothetical protein Kpol_1013p66 [Vanderwaltozyma polyspora DSM 70294]
MGLRYSSYIDSPVAVKYETLKDNPAFSYRDNRMLKKQSSKFITYGCRHCRTHLSSYSQIMSKDYRGKTGNAYLMKHVVNVIEGKPEKRSMITGDYIVCDILCHWCKNTVGWKYLESERKDQRYKEGTFVLELQTICKCE